MSGVSFLNTCWSQAPTTPASLPLPKPRGKLCSLGSAVCSVRVLCMFTDVCCCSRSLKLDRQRQHLQLPFGKLLDGSPMLCGLAPFVEVAISPFKLVLPISTTKCPAMNYYKNKRAGQLIFAKPWYGIRVSHINFDLVDRIPSWFDHSNTCWCPRVKWIRSHPVHWPLTHRPRGWKVVPILMARKPTTSQNKECNGNYTITLMKTCCIYAKSKALGLHKYGKSVCNCTQRSVGNMPSKKANRLCSHNTAPKISALLHHERPSQGKWIPFYKHPSPALAHMHEDIAQTLDQRMQRASIPSVDKRFRSSTNAFIKHCTLAPRGAYLSDGRTMKSIRVVNVCLLKLHMQYPLTRMSHTRLNSTHAQGITRL